MGIMRIVIVFLFAATILIVACWNKKRKEGGQDKQGREILSVKKAVTVDNLVGGWVTPIPQQEPGTQGVQFNRNGSATAINMHTLLYDKWQLKEDTILLWSTSIGVREVSSYIDTLIVRMLTDSILNVVNTNGMRTSYTRIR